MHVTRTVHHPIVFTFCKLMIAPAITSMKTPISFVIYIKITLDLRVVWGFYYGSSRDYKDNHGLMRSKFPACQRQI